MGVGGQGKAQIQPPPYKAQDDGSKPSVTASFCRGFWEAEAACQIHPQRCLVLRTAGGVQKLASVIICGQTRASQQVRSPSPSFACT